MCPFMCCVTKFTDDVNLLPVHCTLAALLLLRGGRVKCGELISLCFMWTIKYFKMLASLKGWPVTLILSSSHCLLVNWKNQRKAVCMYSDERILIFWFYCYISDWSSHYVWWGVWLPHQIPSAGWFWRGENKLPLSIHRRQVQLQVYHYSGNWL